MAAPTDQMLLLIGSGPGIGVAVASRFIQQHFSRVALIARNPEQLQKDRQTVLTAAAKANREVTVQTWQVDIGNLDKLQQALDEIAQFGTLECVYFNAARVGLSPFFEFPIEDLEEDFRVSNLALYVTARWAMPLLSHKQPDLTDWNPSLLITNSLLPIDPIPQLFALSMVKAAQANLAKSLEKTFSPLGVHVGLVVVGGMVSPENEALNPGNIAEQAWGLFAQKPGEWTGQVTVWEDGKIDWGQVI
ncbi:hypothetical protein BDW59DRAFT_87545 [Aspergillus cavernicola]|uniref:Short-chain alcohol dehydrogenase n=1 Tax=Aspergillus cavernicola TaxID=176166 RepID=A0ABR4I917_9EURO